MPSDRHRLFVSYASVNDGPMRGVKRILKHQLGWPIPDPSQLAYYQKVDDLGRSIARKIQQIEAESST
jgi:hypothetical protein